MQADILGSLSDRGVFETAEGALPDPGPIEMVKTPGGWRIDKLPNGVFLDWQQFQATYKRNTLYFVDPTGKTVVPDPRYVAVSDPDQLATELVTKLSRARAPRWPTRCATCSARRCVCAVRSPAPTAARPGWAAVTAARASTWTACRPPTRTAGNCLPRRSSGRCRGRASTGPT